MTATNSTHWRKLGIFGVSALIIAVGGGVALAVPAALAERVIADHFIDGDFEEAMLKHFEKRFFQRIDATEDQKKQLSAIFLTQMQSTREQREAVRHKVIELADFAASDKNNDQQVRDKAAELRTMREKLMDSRLDCLLKVRQILTEDQRKAIADRVANLVSGNGMMKRKIGLLIENSNE